MITDIDKAEDTQIDDLRAHLRPFSDLVAKPVTEALVELLSSAFFDHPVASCLFKVASGRIPPYSPLPRELESELRAWTERQENTITTTMLLSMGGSKNMTMMAAAYDLIWPPAAKVLSCFSIPPSLSQEQAKDWLEKYAIVIAVAVVAGVAGMVRVCPLKTLILSPGFAISEATPKTGTCFLKNLLLHPFFDISKATRIFNTALASMDDEKERQAVREHYFDQCLATDMRQWLPADVPSEHDTGLIEVARRFKYLTGYGN